MTKIKIMTKEEFTKQLPTGWEVTAWRVHPKLETSIEYFEYGGETILTVKTTHKNKPYHMSLLVTGDIYIVDPKDDTKYFKKKYDGKASGELTKKLLNHGTYESNNWFEINENGSSYQTCEEVAIDIDDAIALLLDRVKNCEFEYRE
ncbi:MAG: hypothetical protein WC307_05990 [Candidatus Nanoarchaeia archaeon]|jgi:hypothetical protein